MLGSWDPSYLPNLTAQNCKVTSPATRVYNCIAWAASDDALWWWPDDFSYWPPDVAREITIGAFMQLYALFGYVECVDGTLETGFEKIALYAKRMPWGEVEPTHAARQLPDGQWTSKLGPCEDVTHATPSDVDGPSYGTPIKFLKRLAISATT
jgi:hypothetical protein